MPQAIGLVNSAEPSTAFCRTPTAADILRVVELSRRLRCIGSVLGAPGVGKTTTLTWYAESDPGVHYCVMNPAQSALTAMLSRVGGALGIAAPYRSAQLHERICAWARRNERQALLIDEAQHLSNRSLDELRCIHDETGLALVFAGNENLRNRFNDCAAGFGQFTSRIGPRVELRGAAAADAGALARHCGAQEPKAVAFLEKRIRARAGLRQVANLLALAREIAGHEAIRLNHLKRADAVLGALQ